MKRIFYVLILLLTLTTLSFSGNISGIVVDSETGEGLIGVNVYLENTTIGTGTDLDGSFFIYNIPDGNYNVIFQMISYQEKYITNVSIEGDEPVRLDVVLSPEEIVADEVVVEARMLQNTEASLLKERQKSISVSDAISAETISNTGSSDAGDAMKRVTGASVVDGKYVYVRGLGERYSNTMLNGAELPTSDPDRKSVQYDMLPSSILDNITTIKTFTPDKPGNFTGGMVNINTKAYPDQLIFKSSIGVSYNSISTYNPNYLAYPGSDTDWFGFDNGLRVNPIDDPSKIPTYSEARVDEQAALELDKYSKSFYPVMSPTNKVAPINKSFSLSFGNQQLLFGKRFGYLGSFSYKRDFSFYDNGKVERWSLGTAVSTTDSLNPKIRLSDTRGSDEVYWGGLVTLSYQLARNHDLSTNIIYNQSGISTSRYLVGNWPEQFGPSATNVFFETRTLKYVQRNIQSYQLSGNHYFNGIKLDWQGSLSQTKQDEPDTRFFSNHYAYRENLDTTIYSLSPSNYPQPSRYFRNLSETNNSGTINLKWRFVQVGGLYEEKNRNFDEIRFQYERQPYLRYDGDPETFFSDKVGIDSTGRFGNYIVLSPDPRGGSYSGDQQISAFYSMFDFIVFRNYRFVIGARYEITKMVVEGADTTKDAEINRGELKNKDLLPAASFIYSLDETKNIRLSYGKTLARPTFREKAPYVSFDFVNDYSYAGNVNLRLTTIDNYDIRFEWFERPGEIYSVSGFYKLFTDPIERTIVSGSSADNPEITYRNVDKGELFGIEFEIRKSLDQIKLKNFNAGINVSLIHSKVNLPQEKIAIIEQLDPERKFFTSNSRPLQGQSPYIFNADFGYNNQTTTMFLHYNVFGKRLAEITSDGTPDVYESPFHSLNFTATQKLFRHTSLKLSVKNILDSDVSFVHEYKGETYYRSGYGIGRSYSLGIGYTL